MYVFWGVVLVVFTLVICWVGQIITAFFPKIAARMQIAEAESDVDPVFYADVRGEAIWDSFILWTLPVTGILLILGDRMWVYFGLVGGGSYLYFAGRGIITRLVMQRQGIRIGAPHTLKLFNVFLVLWSLIAIVTIIIAISALPLP